MNAHALRHWVNLFAITNLADLRPRSLSALARYRAWNRSVAEPARCVQDRWVGGHEGPQEGVEAHDDGALQVE